MSGSNSTMAIANPVDVESPRVKSGRLVAALESTLQELNGCRGDAGIQRVSAKVDAIMAQMSDVSAFQAATRDGLLKAIHEAELALKRAGQSVKAGRMGKMRKLMSRLPKVSPKKQRKMLREILQLSGKNAGVAVGKRSFCHSKLCFGVCVTGSVLALAGASVVIALAATGQLGDELPGVGDNTDAQNDAAEQDYDADDDLAEGKKKTLRKDLKKRMKNADRAAGEGKTNLAERHVEKANKILENFKENDWLENQDDKRTNLIVEDGKIRLTTDADFNVPGETQQTIAKIEVDYSAMGLETMMKDSDDMYGLAWKVDSYDAYTDAYGEAISGKSSWEVRRYLESQGLKENIDFTVKHRFIDGNDGVNDDWENYYDSRVTTFEENGQFEEARQVMEDKIAHSNRWVNEADVNRTAVRARFEFEIEDLKTERITITAELSQVQEDVLQQATDGITYDPDTKTIKGDIGQAQELLKEQLMLNDDDFMIEEDVNYLIHKLRSETIEVYMDYLQPSADKPQADWINRNLYGDLMALKSDATDLMDLKSDATDVKVETAGISMLVNLEPEQEELLHAEDSIEYDSKSRTITGDLTRAKAILKNWGLIGSFTTRFDDTLIISGDLEEAKKLLDDSMLDEIAHFKTKVNGIEVDHSNVTENSISFVTSKITEAEDILNATKINENGIIFDKTESYLMQIKITKVMTPDDLDALHEDLIEAGVSTSIGKTRLTGNLMDAEEILRKHGLNDDDFVVREYGMRELETHEEQELEDDLDKLREIKKQIRKAKR